MAGLSAEDVRAAFCHAASAMAGLKAELNAADARLGDGDTGSMLARVLAAIGDRAAAATGSDIGILLADLARTATSGTGSSLGTLLATALLAASKTARGQTELAWQSLGDLLGTAQVAMAARGGAQLGDKTILDAIDAVASSIRGLHGPAEIARRAVAAAELSLAEFRGRPNKVGRARMFAEASVGLDDPGMLAFTRLLAAIVEARASPQHSG